MHGPAKGGLRLCRRSAEAPGLRLLGGSCPGAPAEAHARNGIPENSHQLAFFNLCKSVKSMEPKPFSASSALSAVKHLHGCAWPIIGKVHSHCSSPFLTGKFFIRSHPASNCQWSDVSRSRLSFLKPGMNIENPFSDVLAEFPVESGSRRMAWTNQDSRACAAPSA